MYLSLFSLLTLSLCEAARRFDIGMWCGVPNSFLSPARINQIAAAGITLAGSPCNEPNNITYNKLVLEYAAKAGLKAFLFDDRTTAAAAGIDIPGNVAKAVADYGNASALLAYSLQDEPTAPFPNLAAVVAAIKAKDPTHYGYVNLLPNYASPAQMGAASYSDYVATFISQVQPVSFSYDHYPFYTSSDNPMYFDNLQIVGEQAAKAGIPWWQYIQAIGWSGMRATTEAEKLFQGLMTIAYGGSGFNYFTYWTPPNLKGSPNDWQTGLIDPAGNPTAQYDQATRINKVAYAIGKRTVQGKWEGAFHNGGMPPNTAPLPAFAPVYIPSSAPVVVGLFSTPDGNMLALFVNRDHDNAVSSSVYTASADGQPMILDPNTDQFTPLKAVANLSQISLPAGGGVLVQLKGPVPKGPGGPPVFAGVVRSDQGTYVVVDPHYTAQAIGLEGWGFCPQGYVELGRDFDSNGFWLCVRGDLTNRVFYFGNTVSDEGHIFKVTTAGAVAAGDAGWNQCPQGTLLGTWFNSNGCWVCMA